MADTSFDRGTDFEASVMLISFVTFDFKSPDIQAEERNYLGHHVGLAMRLSGLRVYRLDARVEV